MLIKLSEDKTKEQILSLDMDELFTRLHLDEHLSPNRHVGVYAIIELMKEMNRERGVTVICSTHDHKMLDISDRIVWMRDGVIQKIAKRDEVDIEIHTMTEK